MKTLKILEVKTFSILACTISVLMALLFGDTARADISECSAIEDKALRLQCYDDLSNVKANRSYLEKQWDLDKDFRGEKNCLMPHRDNYFIHSILVDSPDEELDSEEAVFQISLKTKVFQDIKGGTVDFWLAYTQRSWWQVYDAESSSPFRESNYEPEGLFNIRVYNNPLGLKFVNLGINHQSNGQSEPLSRSWNRLVANIGFEKYNFALILNTWIRFHEQKENDDNPDITKYMGHGQLTLYYFLKGARIGVMARNNLRLDQNLNTVQADLSIPVWKFLNIYLQYFNGYGESLADYDTHVERLGLGINFRTW